MNEEFWDIYDENRIKTGRLHKRGEPLAPGDYYLAVMVWIRNSAGQYLVSKRVPGKVYPNRWECTTGAAIAGDSSLETAMKEVQEELGLELKPANGRLLYKHKLKNMHRDIWLFNQDVDIEDVVLQEGETCGAKWASEPEIRAMINSGEFIPVTDYIEQLFRED